MGTKSNVNPNHYKTAGRERQGEDIVQAAHKKKLTRQPGGAGNEEHPPCRVRSAPGDRPSRAARRDRRAISRECRSVGCGR